MYNPCGSPYGGGGPGSAAAPPWLGGQQQAHRPRVPQGLDLGNPLFSSLGLEAGSGEGRDHCDELCERLRAGDPAERERLLARLVQVARPLALSAPGTRVVQKVLDVGGKSARNALFAELMPHAVELYGDPHGNHALCKVVEVMPSEALGPFIQLLVERGAAAVARHRFGCRVLERLIEHGMEREMGKLLDQIVEESGTLCRHPYGNFVVSHLLEHGSVQRREAVARKLMGASLPQLAKHRTASHVVQAALRYCTEGDDREDLVEALLQGKSPNSLIEVACSRYGSFVAEQLESLREPQDAELREKAFRCIAGGLPELRRSPFGQKVALRWGLQVGCHDVVAVGESLEGEGDCFKASCHNVGAVGESLEGQGDSFKAAEAAAATARSARRQPRRPCGRGRTAAAAAAAPSPELEAQD